MNERIGNDDNHISVYEDIEEINGVKIYLSHFMPNVNNTTMNDIRKSFSETKHGKLNEKQLSSILETYNLILAEEDFKPMFAKIDVKKEGLVSFLQFVTYLSYEIEIKSGQNELSEEKLLLITPKLLPLKPITNENNSRYSIGMFAFKPQINQQSQTVIISESEYIATTQTGELIFYTSGLDFNYVQQIDKKWNLKKYNLNGLLVLPEFNVLCLSTTDNNLMFYNATSNEFKLCLTIEKLPSVTTGLAYAYSELGKTTCSRIAIGNMRGDVYVIEIQSTKNISPFQGKPGETHPPTYTFQDIVAWKGDAEKSSRSNAPPRFHVIGFPNLHPIAVNSLVFRDDAVSFLSLSYGDTKSLAIVHLVRCGQAQDHNNPSTGSIRYVVSSYGFNCACVVGKGHLATGSLDKSVRLWDIGDESAEIRSVEFSGHVTGIHHVFHNKANNYLYSVSADRAIKIWDVHKAVCLLTFRKATAVSRDRMWSPAHFNQHTNTFVMVVDDAFVIIRCGKTDDDDDSSALGDAGGESHNTAVVKTMYNSLYRMLVSVSGADSVFSVWSLVTGQLINKRTMAHTKEVYCETLPVEITAATFDPSGGLLVTGAVNGSVHIWDPNNGVCLNRLQIPSKGRISEIIWLPNKVLVTGWDRKVTEFNDPFLVSRGKVWLFSHNEDVLSAIVKLPSLLVTTSRSGEMGFWRLETGQLIKKHKARMKPDSGGSKYSKSSIMASRMSTMSPSAMSYGGGGIMSSRISNRMTTSSRIADGGGGSGGGAGGAETREEMLKRLDIKHTPRGHHAAVASHLLIGRPEANRVGTLLVATRNGVVQLWSTYKAPKYMAQFVAIHLPDDYVTAMASDPKSEYLFTSLNSGFVKTWYMPNFGVGQPRNMIARFPILTLRLKFPFLLGSMYVGRAERANAKNPDRLLLVNSYRAHGQGINHIEYIDGMELLVTSGVDKKIRLWTLAGHYVGTLGLPWSCLQRNGPVTLNKFSIPPDLQRRSSFTTVKVMKDGVKSALRSPMVWKKLEALRQLRELEGKSIKRKLLVANCPEKPLHDVVGLIEESEDEYVTDPMVIKIDETKPKVQVYKYVPLFDISAIPEITMFEKERKE